MTLEQLRVFVAVAERQHVTGAARALNLAQSAASHAIAGLEARYGTRLFDRVGRRIELTEAGRALLGEARTILAQVAAAERILGDFGNLERGTLAIQASQTIASYWLPRHLVAFRHAHPSIAVRLTAANTAQVAAAVESGLAALGFVEGAIESRMLTAAPVARDQLVLVTGPEHPWARGPAPCAKDLLNADWVLREEGSGTRSVFEAALARMGIPSAQLHVALELPSNEAVRAAVEAGLGATALPATVAAPSLDNGLLHRVGVKLPEREFFVLRHKERHAGRAAEALLTLIAAARPPR